MAEQARPRHPHTNRQAHNMMEARGQPDRQTRNQTDSRTGWRTERPRDAARGEQGGNHRKRAGDVFEQGGDRASW